MKAQLHSIYQTPYPMLSTILAEKCFSINHLSLFYIALTFLRPPSRRRRSAVQRTTAVAQAFRGLFGCDVALGLGHELVADEELPHGGAAEEGWVEVDVEVGGFDFFEGAG